MRYIPLLFFALSSASEAFSFHGITCLSPVHKYAESKLSMATNDKSDIDLKVELTAYLKKRDEMNADEAAKENVGKVVGGTKGNAVLEYVSGSPNKEFVVEEVPDIFDYDELTKYGYSHLVTPIMDAGGRREMYKLMDMPVPPIPDRIKPKRVTAQKLVIDRTGENDQARYSGLKISQSIDDDEIGRRLMEVQTKVKEGESTRPKLMEEDFEMPFADKRNVSPQMTPDWTPQRLDEEAKRAGQAVAWARAARAGEFKKDPFEALNIEGSLQIYSIVSVLFASFAFGNSSSALLKLLNYGGEGGSESAISDLLGILQAPALAIVVGAFGSSILCSGVLAPPKNRSSFVWGVKGLAGGPLAILQLRTLDALQTRGEVEALK